VTSTPPTLSWGDLPGVSERADGLLMAELAAGDAAVRSLAFVQGALVMWPIHEHGSDAQRERLLPRLGNVETTYTDGGTHDIHSLVLGEPLTNIPAYEG